MKLFSEKVEPTFTNSSFNILQVENYSEIFFDVYEIELNKIKYPAEKISSFRGNPVVSVPVVIGEKEQEFPFVLIKGKPSILFNENNIDAPVDNSIEIQDDTEVIFENIDLEHESRIKEETKRELMEHIEIAKQNAQKHAEELKLQKIREANLEIRKKNKLLKESLNTAKQELVNEFVSITKSIKRELIKDADEKYSELEITIDNKIEDLANRLSESIEEDFQNSSKELETNIRSFVKSIHNESVLPELRKSLESIAKDAVSKISGIERNLDKKLDEKVDVSVIQELSSELDALRNTNVELNNNINKGVNKALSRIGNVNNRIDEVSSDVIRQLDEKISNTAENISNYYSEKLKSLEDQTFDINEKSRKYFIDLVRESRDNLISEIRKIQKEAPVELVIEAAGKKKTKSLDSIEKDIDKKISDRVSDEVIKLRKYIAVYSSGGGSVAQQFANGGVMNGNLTIVGAISASQYLGLSAGGSGVSGDYLPLSGGTINGNLTVNGRLSADTTPSGLTNTIKGNTNITGTGFNQLLVDYDNSVTINGDYGVNINANSGLVYISGASGITLESSNNINLNAQTVSLNPTTSLVFNTSGFSYATGSAGLHRTALGSGATGDELFRDNTPLEARQTLYTERLAYDPNPVTITNPATYTLDSGLSGLQLTSGIWEVSFFFDLNIGNCGAQPKFGFNTSTPIINTVNTNTGMYVRGNQAPTGLGYSTATPPGFQAISQNGVVPSWPYTGSFTVSLTGDATLSTYFQRTSSVAGTSIIRKGGAYLRARKVNT